MKLQKEKVAEWYEAMAMRSFVFARIYLMPFLMFARVWDEVDVPQVAGKLVDEAVNAERVGDSNLADFLIDAAADLRQRANEEPQ